MPESSEQPVDLFVVEPVTQLDGSPVPQKAGPGGNSWRTRLGPPGMVALAEGLALLCCFCFPWVYFPDLLASGILGVPSSSQYSGWVTALGIPFVRETRLAFFVHLWLVPLTAVALLALALLYMQRRFSARLTLGVLVALSVLALLVELGFYWEVVLLGPALFNGGPDIVLIGVEWGVWAAVAVNVAAIAACMYLLRSSRFADIETGGSLPGQ